MSLLGARGTVGGKMEWSGEGSKSFGGRSWPRDREGKRGEVDEDASRALEEEVVETEAGGREASRRLSRPDSFIGSISFWTGKKVDSCVWGRFGGLFLMCLKGLGRGACSRECGVIRRVEK